MEGSGHAQGPTPEPAGATGGGRQFRGWRQLRCHRPEARRSEHSRRHHRSRCARRCRRSGGADAHGHAHVRGRDDGARHRGGCGDQHPVDQLRTRRRCHGRGRLGRARDLFPFQRPGQRRPERPRLRHCAQCGRHHRQRGVARQFDWRGKGRLRWRAVPDGRERLGPVRSQPECDILARSDRTARRAGSSDRQHRAGAGAERRRWHGVQHRRRDHELSGQHARSERRGRDRRPGRRRRCHPGRRQDLGGHARRVRQSRCRERVRDRGRGEPDRSQYARDHHHARRQCRKGHRNRRNHHRFGSGGGHGIGPRRALRR